jgi:hypothetical protein
VSFLGVQNNSHTVYDILEASLEYTGGSSDSLPVFLRKVRGNGLLYGGGGVYTPCLTVHRPIASQARTGIPTRSNANEEYTGAGAEGIDTSLSIVPTTLCVSTRQVAIRDLVVREARTSLCEADLFGVAILKAVPLRDTR